MATYQAPYDPNSYITKGYQLPTQQIMGALSARTQYYLQSAQKIKNDYDTSFHKLSNENNIAAQDAMKQQADQQLKGIIKNDLSIGDYSSQAHKIFTPIATNADFIKDEQFTNQIHNGLQQAQTDLKKFGADHYNMKSVQVMQDNLADWSKADPKDIDMYANDTLATSYQPYDPKVEKEFQKTLTDRIKNNKIKKEYSDGQGRIVTTEYADLNSLQAQEWINEIRPQQSKVQDQLDARILASRLRKGTPEEQAQLLKHVEDLKTFNAAKQVSYIEAEKNKYDLAFHLASKEDQVKNKDIYQKNVGEYDKSIKATKDQYSSWDSSAYFSPYKKNVAQNQLETLMGQRSVNSLVDGLGLQNTSSTTKTDTAFWNQKNLDFNDKKLQHEDAFRTAKLQIDAAKVQVQAMKGNGKKGGVGAENPLEEAAPLVAAAGTNNQTDAEKTAAAGQLLQTTLKGQLEAKQSSGISGLMNQMGVKVNKPDGYGTEDFYTALDNEVKTNPKATLADITDRLTGGDEKNKKLIYALIQEGAKKRTNGQLYRESTLPNISGYRAKLDLKVAMADPEIFNAAVKKAGIDSGNLDASYQIGYQNASIAYDEKSQENQYGKVYKDVAKAFGIPNAANRGFTDLRDYDVDQYVADLSQELKTKGYAQKDIDNLKTAIKENKQLTDKIPIASPTTMTGSVPFMSNQDYSHSALPSLQQYKQKWDNYQTALNTKLGERSTGASNFNTLGYQVVNKSELGKSFDPATDFHVTDFTNLVLNHTTSTDVNGKAKDGDFTEKLKNVIRLNPKIIAGFQSYSDGNDTFMTVNLNTTAENKKILSDAGLSPDDVLAARIHVDNTGRKDIGFKEQSPSALQLKNGKVFGAHTLSGKDFKFYGTGDTDDNGIPQLNFDGSIMMATVDPTGRGFQLKEVPLATMANDPGSPIKKEQLALAGDDAGKFLYGLDGDAVRISDILRKYHIDPKDNFVEWASLPKEVKAELKKVRNTFDPTKFTD